MNDPISDLKFAYICRTWKILPPSKHPSAQEWRIQRRRRPNSAPVQLAGDLLLALLPGVAAGAGGHPAHSGDQARKTDRQKLETLFKKICRCFCQVALPGRLRLWPPHLHWVPGCKEKLSSLCLRCCKQKFLLGLEKLFTMEFFWFNLAKHTIATHGSRLNNRLLCGFNHATHG